MVTWMAKPEINMTLPLGWQIKGFPGKHTKSALPIVPDRREIILLLRHADRQYRPMFAVWYYGGLRKQGLLTMTGEKVNLEQRYMIIREKGDKERVVPIHRKIGVYIRKHWRPGLMWLNPRTGKPYVFLTRALTRRSEVQILSPQPKTLKGFGAYRIPFCMPGAVFWCILVHFFKTYHVGPFPINYSIISIVITSFPGSYPADITCPILLPAKPSVMASAYSSSES